MLDRIPGSGSGHRIADNIIGIIYIILSIDNAAEVSFGFHLGSGSFLCGGIVQDIEDT